MIAALGIVLRGVSFAFRKAVVTTRNRRLFGAGFAVSSVLVPYCMGAIVGGIASERVPAGGRAGDPVNSWINPTSVVGGVLAVAAAAYLSAVYLVWDARRLGETDVAEYFRRRAVASAIVVAVIATAGAFVLHADAAYVFDGLTGRALPVLILSGACGAGALLLLIRGAARGARALALAAVASAVVAWGVAQSPYILPESLTFSAAAAPSGTLTAVLAVVVLAAVIVLPGFVLLYVLDQRGLLPEEGVDDMADRAPDRRARQQPATAIGHDRRQH
jgi:cytochrome bd ubiquinol oxidase subunit II